MRSVESLSVTLKWVTEEVASVSSYANSKVDKGEVAALELAISDSLYVINPMVTQSPPDHL